MNRLVIPNVSVETILNLHRGYLVRALEWEAFWFASLGLGGLDAG
jgi:hypothetical protein